MSFYDHFDKCTNTYSTINVIFKKGEYFIKLRILQTVDTLE